MTLELGPTRIRGGIWGYGRLEGAPVTADLSSPFGPRLPILTPTGWTSNHHGGIDLPAWGGTPILHAGDRGICTASGPALTGYGNCAFVKTDSGHTLLYAHMQPGLHVGAGQVVERGGIIGQVGTTGASTGDHLHFGVMQKDLPTISSVDVWLAKELWINPMDYFREVIQVGTVVTEPEVPSQSEQFILDFVQNSLLALAQNPPPDISEALREMGRRVEYLRSLL